MESGFIYFVHAEGTTRYKIGLTIDLDRRMRELNGKQSPFENKLLWYVEVEDMRSAESDLHQTFASRRVNGEWFHFDESELDAVEAEYDRVESQYSHQYEPQPEPEPVYRSYSSSYEAPPWVMGLGVVAVVVAALAFMKGLNPGTPHPVGSAVYVTEMASIKRRANVRKTPNGAIICVLPQGEKIEVHQNGTDWLDTDTCGTPGRIHKSVLQGF